MKYFTASDGAEIAFTDDGNGVAVLMLHGLNAHGGLFEPQAEALHDRFRIIRSDFRGHGATPATPAPDIARLAADVAELIDHLDLHDVIGVGWSLGATVLWETMTGDHADRFAGQVIIDMSPKVLNDANWQFGLINPEMRDAPVNETDQQRGLRIAKIIAATDDDDSEIVRWMAPYLSVANLEAVASIGQSLLDQDFRDQLKKLGLPTLVTYGARSRFYPPEASRYIAESSPKGSVVRFEQSGHAPHLQEPELFNKILLGFIVDIEFIITNNAKINSFRR